MVAAISRALLVISPAASLPEERTKEFLLDLDSDTANVNKTTISNYKDSQVSNSISLSLCLGVYKLANNHIVNLLVPA